MMEPEIHRHSHSHCHSRRLVDHIDDDYDDHVCYDDDP